MDLLYSPSPSVHSYTSSKSSARLDLKSDIEKVESSGTGS